MVFSPVVEPEVFALVCAAAELSPEVVAFVVEPEVAFAAPFSIVHVSGPQVSVRIHTVFAVSIPVSVVVEGVDIFRRSIFFLFPNIDCYTSLSSSVQDVDKESVGSPTGARANDGPCSILSNRSLCHNKNMGYICNKPNPDRSNVNDTIGLPMGATTNLARKRCLPLYREQRRHMFQVSLLPPVLKKIR